MVKTRMVRDIIIVEMSQEADEKQRDELIQVIEQMLIGKVPPQAVLCNLKKVGVINSQALGLIMILQQMVNDHKKKFGVYNSSEVNLEVFRLSQLDQVIQIYSDEAEALAMLN